MFNTGDVAIFVASTSATKYTILSCDAEYVYSVGYKGTAGEWCTCSARWENSKFRLIPEVDKKEILYSKIRQLETKFNERNLKCSK
ncbi:MAG: hypothetical protein A3F67_10865 [Verrucomicrobia bacterium RIFCSPHIGHO2_12_FULL_41_10]|nr:MAG: hypothetical protein A3F67_10865 [Verrucomicrobia bacterium RIFCSPHIGHO2_12_FULL_41_10]